MKTKKVFSPRQTLAVAVVLGCLLTLCAAFIITVCRLEVSLAVSSRRTTEDFTVIMEEYLHSFRLFENLMQLEVDKADDEDEIAAYLKTMDGKLSALEGEDYDGIYMYYHDRYLYSWDTPYSVYEQSGYNAAQRPWYTGAVAAAGDLWFSVPYRSYANDYMLSTISRLQPDGETVFAYDIKLGAIQSYVSTLELYRGSLTMLCDPAGNIIGTTEPLYAGGNYLLSQEDFDTQLMQARAALSAADDADEQTKAEKKVDAVQALQAFCGVHQAGIRPLTANPETLRLHRGTLGFCYTNESYNCITLIPLARILPTVLLLWLPLWALAVLLIMLYVNMQGRMRSTQELKEKNAQLADAVVRADAANVAKSQFLAQMSHEIRTPMNAVIGLTGIAKTEIRSPEKIAEYLTKIESSSRLLLSIINDVLDMSAIEGGKLKIDSGEFDFRRMLSNITTLFYEQARQKGIHFEVRMNGVTEERMIGDELRVNQVLMNLLSNAIKFTPAGGEIDLMVLQASRSQGKVQLRFSVSDTGCGMSEEMMGRLFKPFEQESASTARKHGGSGLGLSITKRLVEMMGGSIQVQSTQGKGSVFTVDLPFGLTKTAAAAATPTFTDIHALVVDDDKASCEYSGILLQRLGVRYEYVTSGEAALEALGDAEDKGDPFTLCLIDWKMPEMDGGQLTAQIHEIFGEDAIVIIVSAYDLNEVEASGRSLGTNYFIPKPLFQSTLFNALMRISGGDYTKVEAQRPAGDYDFTGKRVLVAEDVALNMEVAVKLLNKVGIEVTCAEDGRQTVDLFRQSRPGQYDCILMDINMPVMDGYEAAQAIRSFARPDAKTIPIYAMTANAFAEDVTAALNAGMNGHIAKPIETAILYRTLETVFYPNGREDAAPQQSKESEETV